MTHSSSTTTTPNKRGPVDQHQLEEWGAHCSLPSCNMLDFLPLKCPECERLFCSSHFKPSLISSDSDHLCEKLVLKSINAETINKSTTNPKTNKSGTNNKKCSYVKCKTLMFSPITCKSCQLSYCPTHRLEQDHLCKPSSSSSSSFTSKSIPASTKPITNQGNMLGYPNLMKNLLIHKTNNQKLDSSTDTQSYDQPINLGSNFSLKQTMTKIKVNQRNKSELESKQKALEFRIKNGLLTEADKLELQKLEEKRPNHKLSNTSHHGNKLTITKTKTQSDCCIV